MKKVAIMQPYFFPYIGYISLIKGVDEFIIFDTPQFMRHGWIERNRILKGNGEWLYIKAPLSKHSRDTAIKDIALDETTDWRSKIMSQLDVYKKEAPYFTEVSVLVKRAIYAPAKTITELDEQALRLVCEYLEISTPIKTFSKMGLDVKTPTAPDEWALNICLAMGDTDEYWNPPGGKSFFTPKKYSENKIKLAFMSSELCVYPRGRYPFEPGLSIIDVLMFNNKKRVNEMLDSYELEYA